MEEILDITGEITKLVKLSPRRGSEFQRLKDELAHHRILEFASCAPSNGQLRRKLWKYCG